MQLGDKGAQEAIIYMDASASAEKPGNGCPVRWLHPNRKLTDSLLVSAEEEWIEDE